MSEKKKKKGFLVDKTVTSSSISNCKAPPAIAGGMRSVMLLGVALIVVILAVYWQVGDHEFLDYDDKSYITENTHVSTGMTASNIIWAFTSVHLSNWHPITWLSHQVDAQLYGMDPRGHHLTNVIIHAIASVLLLFLLFRLTGSFWQSSFVAALFALHPLHVESVAWVAQRKDVLSAFFWFLTLLLYAEYVAKRGRMMYLLTLFFFIMGLMSKPMLVTLPVVMLLMDFWPLNRYGFNTLKSGEFRLPDMTLLTEKIPFLVCSLLSSAVTIYAQKGDAINFLDVVPLRFRLENAITAYGKYIAQMFWPHDMAVLYPLIDSIPLWQLICSLFVLLIVSAASLRLWRHHPYLVVGWLWFLVTLVPVIGLIQVGSQSMADRYTYIPLIGLFIMIAWGAPVLAKDLPYQRFILALSAAAVVVASTAVTWQQIGYWQDSVSLYQNALNVTFDNYVVHYNLGIILGNKGDLDGAIKEFQEVLTIRPNHSDAHNNLGVALARKGDLDAAIKEYQKALTIRPNDSLAYYNMGIALEEKRKRDKAGK